MSSRSLALALTAFTIAGFGTLMGLRESLSWVTGDEGTYMAMAESLAHDGDLLFTRPDIERAEAAGSDGERNLILQKTRLGISYSKPVLYPLVASPFTLVAGRYGPIVLNVLALAGAAWLAYLYLLRIGSSDRRLTLVTFVGASALPAYLTWRMSDSLVTSCMLAGLVLALSAVRRTDRSPPRAPFLEGPIAPLLGGALLGFATSMRYPNALLAVAAFGALLLVKDWRRAALLLMGLAIAAVTAFGLTAWLTGTPDPYRTPRSTFDAAVGYPDGIDSEIAIERFDGPELATVRLRTRPRPRVVAYSALYFLIGRHTGLLIYFPAALVLVLLALRRPDRVTIVLLAAVGGIVLFYLFLLPHNYFGGAAAIGNRYFMAAYPALLVAQREVPKPRWMLAPWLIAFITLLSATWSVWLTRETERTSQAHAYAGIFRLLPFESTLQTIEGSKERFWLHDWEWEMLHFNDPFQRLGGFSFTLETGRPSTEIEIANTRGQGLLRFLVLSEAPDLLLDYRDWGRSETLELSRPVGERGVVEIEPSRAWRAHPFWFHWRLDDIFHARLFRLGIRTKNGAPAKAEIRYLGPAEIPTDIYAYERLGAELPTLAGAGTVSTAVVSVRNTSTETWKSDRVLAVYLSYKLFYRADSGLQAIEGARTPLPRAIAPGEILESEIEVRWPGAARNYGLAVDLILEGVAWFEQHNGAPIAESEVRVVTLPRAEPAPIDSEPAPTATPEAGLGAEADDTMTESDSSE